MYYEFHVDFKGEEKEPIVVTGSIFSRYTDYEGKKPCEMLIIETIEGDLQHVPIASLKAKTK
jgi:hypothetical protein